MCIQRKKFKIRADYFIVNTLIYFLFWIIAGFNFNNPDYEGYKVAYESQSGEYEAIYSSLTRLFKNMGISYTTYLALLGIIIVILYIIAIRHYTQAHWKVILCVLISPMGLFMTQVRSFLAYAVFFCALNILLDEYRKDHNIRLHKVFVYIVLVAICSGIQNTLIFYLVFLFAKKFSPKKVILPLGIFLVIFNFVFGDKTVLVSILESLNPIVPFYKTYFYLYTSHVRPNINGLIATYVLYLVGLVSIVVLLRNEYIESGANGSFFKYCNDSTSLYGLFFRCYIMISAIMPFCTIDTTFERLYFYMYPFIYLMYVADIETLQSARRKTNTRFVLLGIALFGLFYMIYVNGNLESIVIPMFRDNYILNPFRL